MCDAVFLWKVSESGDDSVFAGAARPGPSVIFRGIHRHLARDV